MPKTYQIKINIDTITTCHLLGGMAQAYRSIPASAPSSVSLSIRIAIYDILKQIENQGADLLNPRSPFKSYVKLINYNN